MKTGSSAASRNGWPARLAAILVTISVSVSAFAQTPRPQPEGPSGTAAPRPAVVAERQMVAAANPVAADVGRQILRQGGSAVDAAIAMQMVLTLVEPQSSGVGGGAFLVHYNAETKKIETYDGRETAPAGARAEMFLDADGKALPFRDRREGRPRGRRARPRRHALPRARRSRAPAVGAPVRAGNAPCHRRLRDLAAPAPARVGHAPAQGIPGDARILLRCRGQSQGGRHAAREPGAGRDAAHHRQRKRAGLLHGRARPRDGARGRRKRHARPADGRGSQELQGGQARADLRALPPVQGLRHGAAVVGGRGHRADPRHDRAFRPATDGPQLARRGPHADGSRAPRLRRPRALYRRRRFRAGPARQARRQEVSRRTLEADQPGPQHGQGGSGPLPARRPARARQHERAARDDAFLGRRRCRQRRRDDPRRSSRHSAAA